MDAVTRANAFQFVEFGEAGAARAGGSRAAAHVQLRNALYEARDYARSPAASEGGRSRESLLRPLDAAALAPVVEGEQPHLVRVESAADQVGRAHVCDPDTNAEPGCRRLLDNTTDRHRTD